MSDNSRIEAGICFMLLDSCYLLYFICCCQGSWRQFRFWLKTQRLQLTEIYLVRLNFLRNMLDANYSLYSLSVTPNQLIASTSSTSLFVSFMFTASISSFSRTKRWFLVAMFSRPLIPGLFPVSLSTSLPAFPRADSASVLASHGC